MLYHFKLNHFLSRSILLGIVVMHMIVSILPAQDEINFKQIIARHNNKNVKVSSAVQDSHGFMWMNANHCMLKYNGYNYQYIDKTEVFPSISEVDKIEHIQCDESKNVWFASKFGLLSKYDSKLGVYEEINNQFDHQISIFTTLNNKAWAVTRTGNLICFNGSTCEIITSLPNINGRDNEAVSIDFVDDKNLYISTSKGKIYNYSIDTQILSELEGPYSDYPGSIVLKSDRHGKLWIGTEAFGLLVYDIHRNDYIQSSFLHGDIKDLHKELFIKLILDSRNNIWGGTDGDGLYKINSTNGQVNHYTKDNFNKFSLGSNTIINISEDSHENIWVFDNYGSIYVIPKIKDQIKYHKGSANNIPLKILSIHKDSQENIWLGTDGNGLTFIDAKTHKCKHYFEEQNFYIQSIVEDRKGHIWVGTYKNGLWHFDQNKKTFEKIKVENNLKQKALDIRKVYVDSRGRIWVGSNVSINVFDHKQTLLASFNYEKNGLSGNIPESIVEDERNQIWLGIYGAGLFRFEENDDDFSESLFIHYKSPSDGLVPGFRSMSVGRQNELWLVNNQGKLMFFDTKSNTFTKTPAPEQITNQTLCTVNHIDEDNIWFSSSYGIHQFDRKANKVQTYYTVDGFQTNSFMTRSSFYSADSLLFFGSVEGVNYFNPHTLIKEQSHAELFITDIEVLNKPAKSMLADQVTSDVYTLDKLELKNEQSSFSVKFSALENILSSRYHYRYRLKGFEEEWKSDYGEGVATYTNVPSGRYILQLKAQEINNQNTEYSKELIIRIAQPFWKKPLALLIYALLICLIGYSIYKWYKLKKNLLINKIMHRKENELHESKMTFFAKMSHEIQTPITLILGPIEDMLKGAEQSGNMLLKERLTIISNNATRLSRIARELTLIKHQKANKLSLCVAHNRICSDMHTIGLSFKELARTKKIDFAVICPSNLENTYYDKEKVEHILYNLIANAFKFTPTEGNITLTVSPIKNKSWIKFQVSDSGPGIKKEELDKIFELFYTAQAQNKVRGSGIGLALTKELVILHKGKISVKSSAGEGTTFSVKIPITEEAYDDHEKIISGKVVVNDELHKPAEHKSNTEEKDHSKKSILVVEDNFELQKFIKELLQSDYNILLAENGEEGFYLAKNNVPDLIISDIMMPVMDGIQMCKELNKHSYTKHIPVILLTAKNSTTAKIEGLKTGALEYINKPFNTNELILKVNNIMTSRENIISEYRKELINSPEVKQSKSQDELFLEKLTASVNDRIADSNFKVQELADVLNMSYSSLYRKCQSLTGMSLIDYVRMLRLRKAAVLLTDYGYSISEVAFKVGFNDPKYFSKSFKSQFNMTPRDYKNKKVTEKVNKENQKPDLDQISPVQIVDQK